MRTKTTLLVGGLLIGALIFTSGVSAVAVNLITGRDIVDRSITRADIKNGTITKGKLRSGTISGTEIRDDAITSAKIQDGAISGSDIKDGSLNAADLAPSANGAGPDPTVYEWTYTHTADGTEQLEVSSAQLIPTSTAVRALSVVVNGLDGCGYTNYLAVSLGSSEPIVYRSATQGSPLYERLVDGSSGAVQAKRLQLSSNCQASNGDYVALPTFTMKLRFTQEADPDGAAVAFN